MFTIQSMMLISLGFLMAMLLGFVVAPAYWARAVRLTSDRLRRSLPVTETEVRADKDRLRAQHAIRVHQLVTQVDSARMSAARQKVEINRRDAAISTLERNASELNTNLEASENARRVLEQTIMDRVPRIEDRLAEARKLLFQRDREMAALQADTSKTFRALDEAMQINAQQRAEIDRLKSTVATRGSRAAKNGAADGASESEVALRSEIEALRARTRDQASLISKLQELVAETGPSRTGSAAEQAERKKELVAQVAQLDSGLEHAQNILKSVANNDSEAVFEQADAMRELMAKNEAQATEIEKLKASLRVFEDDGENTKSRPLRDSKIALKARVAALEKETAGQSDTIRRLSAELAAANDRSARQAAHHMNEMRRLGVGTVPAAINSSQKDQTTYSQRHLERRTLADRITETVPGVSADLARTPPQAPQAVAPKDPSPPDAVSQPAAADINSAKKAPTVIERVVQAGSADAPDTKPETPPEPAVAASIATDQAAAGKDKNNGRRRGGLMQRIAGIGES